MDMGIGNRSKRWTRILAEDLEVGNVFDIDGQELTIMEIDENEMKFHMAYLLVRNGDQYIYCGKYNFLSEEWIMVSSN